MNKPSSQSTGPKKTLTLFGFFAITASMVMTVYEPLHHLVSSLYFSYYLVDFYGSFLLLSAPLKWRRSMAGRTVVFLPGSEIHLVNDGVLPQSFFNGSK